MKSTDTAKLSQVALSAQSARTNLKSDRTRQQILLAAVEVAQDRDLEAVRFAQIAAAAGVSRATVYNYFDSPDDVFKALASEYRREILVFLDRVEAEIGDPVLRIAVALSGVLRRVDEDPRWGVFVARWRQPDVSLITQKHVARWVFEASEDDRVDLDPEWAVEGSFLLRGVANFAMSPHDPPVVNATGRHRLISLLLGTLGVDRSAAKEIAAEAESFPGMDPRFFV